MCTTRFNDGIQIPAEYLMGMLMTCEPSKKSCTKFHENFSSQVLIGRWCVNVFLFICM